MKEENSRIDIQDILSLFLLYSFLLSGCGALDAFLMNYSWKNELLFVTWNTADLCEGHKQLLCFLTPDSTDKLL